MASTLKDVSKNKNRLRQAVVFEQVRFEILIISNKLNLRNSLQQKFVN